MKIKVLLVALLSLSVVSCIKDHYGHPDDKDLVLTESNYFYSDDFKTTFYEIEVEKLNDEIKELDAIIDAGQGTEETQEKLDTAKANRLALSNELIEIAGLREAVYRRRPPLPGPCPKNGNCDWPGIQYIAIPTGLEFYELVIFDANGGFLGSTQGSPESVGRAGNLLDYVVFLYEGEGYQGEITVQIKEKAISDNEITSFVVNSDIGGQ